MRPSQSNDFGFFVIKFSLFPDIQIRMSARRLSIRVLTKELLPFLKEIYRWQSSAYIWIPTLQFLAIFPSGSRYIVKSRGPKTESCGTPNLRSCISSAALSIRALHLLSVRYDLNQFRQLPVIPKWLPRRQSRSCMQGAVKRPSKAWHERIVHSLDGEQGS